VPEVPLFGSRSENELISARADAVAIVDGAPKPLSTGKVTLIRMRTSGRLIGCSSSNTSPYPARLRARSFICREIRSSSTACHCQLVGAPQALQTQGLPELALPRNPWASNLRSALGGEAYPRAHNPMPAMARTLIFPEAADQGRYPPPHASFHSRRAAAPLQKTMGAMSTRSMTAFGHRVAT
jgi:hypothetical protein